MSLFRIGLISALLSGSACSPGLAPVSQSVKDPSNPAAPEGVTQASSATQTSSAAQASSATQTSVESSAVADAGPTIYTCPMHPQITSPSPGRCPICGMNLVPRK